MSFDGGWRPHIESALSLSISAMREAGALEVGSRSGTWAWWSDGERVASIGYKTAIHDNGGTLRLDYSTENGARPHSFQIELVATRTYFGGKRLWFTCPYTGRRVCKLYKFSGIDCFCARTAVRPLPTYASQRTSAGGRIMQRRWGLRRKLGDSGSLLDALTKPKHMRWKTFENYERLDLDLEGREWPLLAAKMRRWAGKKAN